MSTLVCIPVHRIKCKVHVDQGRAWTPVEEMALWAVSRRPSSIAELSAEANLPQQVIVSALARLMRFRFTTVKTIGGATKFSASEFGKQAIASGDPLPFFPKRTSRWVSFVIERATGCVLPARDVRRIRQRYLREARASNARIVVLKVTGGELEAGHEAMLARLASFVSRGREEQLAYVEAGTATVRSDDEFIGVTVDNGSCRDLPDAAGITLRELVLEAASVKGGRDTVEIRYAGPADEAVDEFNDPISCEVALEDIVIGGSAQSRLLVDLIGQAVTRLIIHSTFVGLEDFKRLQEPLRTACARGVSVDLLWGAAFDGETEARYGATASDIAALVRGDPILHRRVKIRLQSTGSHAKVVLLDASDGSWLAAVSSCNWLKSPFQAVETTSVLRHPKLVGQVARCIQRMTGRRGLADALANEMALVAQDLCSRRGQDGPAKVSLVIGAEHDALMRVGSRAAQQRFVIGTNKLGSTARPGAILPGETAASAKAVEVNILYTMPTGPIKNRHARELAAEAARSRVRLTKTGRIPLHGKFMLWDNDDVVITSLNWGSASIDPDFPLGDIGVHITAPGIAQHVLERLRKIFPELAGEAAKAA